jgi:hypothetical protein
LLVVGVDLVSEEWSVNSSVALSSDPKRVGNEFREEGVERLHSSEKIERLGIVCEIPVVGASARETYMCWGFDIEQVLSIVPALNVWLEDVLAIVKKEGTVLREGTEEG